MLFFVFWGVFFSAINLQFECVYMVIGTDVFYTKGNLTVSLSLFSFFVGESNVFLHYL